MAQNKAVPVASIPKAGGAVPLLGTERLPYRTIALDTKIQLPLPKMNLLSAGQRASQVKYCCFAGQKRHLTAHLVSQSQETTIEMFGPMG
jgi:hypothetical protein